jgi:hypothetical protein
MKHLSFLFASLFITLFSFAQNLDFSVAVVGSDFSTEILLGSEPALVSDMPYWSVGGSPEWADVSIGSNIVGSPNDFDFIIEYYLIISGVPSPNNIGENIVTVNLINPWTDDVVDVVAYIITVIETEDCVCPAVYAPVCGSDGATYGNSCEADCASVDVDYEGECESTPGCLGDFNIIEQEYIAGFAGMMLHLQVQNNGNDLSTTMASVILANTCASTDQFTFETWASGDVLDMYFNYTCLSMAPYIEPFEAILVLSGTGNCAQDVPFVFDPQGNSTSEGCTADDGTFYANGESWNPDDCTFCACEGGDIMCAVVDCAMPDCDNPVFIEGECCPICPEDCEESLDDEILAIVEAFGVYDCESAVTALEGFGLDCNTDLAAFGPIVGVEIEPGTFLNDYCPCSCENTDEIIGCTDPLAMNYNPMATTDNGSCEYMTDYGCVGEDGDLFPVGAIIEYDNEVCFCTSFNTWDIAVMPYWECEELITMGCMDENALNFNPQASVGDGSCIYSPNNGCIDDNGLFYPIGATFTNFDPSIGVCEMCFCAPNPNSNVPEGMWECEEIIDCGFGMIPGCTDPSASNYNEWANVDDGTCEYGCDCPLDLWDPVCGADGITYSYSCFAECADVDYIDGECEIIDDCICPMIYAPVCGSDGITYGNSCQAECENITEFYEGECLPTSFCNQIEVVAETAFNANGQQVLSVTVYNNSQNNINYPVFDIQTFDDYVNIEPLFENAYWIGAGESTTNTYLLTGDAAGWVEATYYVSQMNQNAACAYPIAFSFEPIWTGSGCFEAGELYPVGSIIEGECETCICEYSPVFALLPGWLCEDIADCADCSEVVCPPGTYCQMGECLPVIPVDFGCTSDNGEWYPFGAIIDVDCNTCNCMPGSDFEADGFWMCTMMPCEEEGCWEGGEFYEIGSELFLNECDYLECEGENNWSDVIEIPGCGQTDFGCEFDGEIYPFGSSIEQGCNSCYCQAGFNPNANGIWSCTEMACGGCTDPEAVNYDEYADWDDDSCEYGTDTNPNWDYPNTGSNHTLVLAEDMLVELDGADIQNGDWIGVFYPLNGELVCAGYAVWEGSTTVIPAQGDDTTTEVQDGFNANQEFQWLVWDASANTTYSMDATYDTNMPNQEQYTTNGISAILTLTAQPLIGEQQLLLEEGWSLFSTYMYYWGMNIVDVFMQYGEDVVIVKNNLGGAWLPEWAYDGIGAMIPGQGYQAKLNNAIELNIEGDYLAPEDNPIDLENGWNLIAYLRTEPADVIAVFEEIQELVIVKDNTGMAYLPEYGFNGIGDMTSGNAYQIKVLAAQQLQYLANNQSYRFEMAAVENNLQHYKTPLNTGANMSLVIEGNQLESLLDFRDEVAVYSTTNQLVGAFVYQDQAIVIPVYGNDDYSKEQDGLLKNEALTLKYWSNEKGEEISLITNWDSSTGLFEQNSIQVASIENAHLEFSKLDFEILPNPATHLAALTFELSETSKVEIQVFNILGDLLFNLESNVYNKGNNSVILKVEDYPVGTYLIKLQTSNAVYTKRLLVQ